MCCSVQMLNDFSWGSPLRVAVPFELRVYSSPRSGALPPCTCLDSKVMRRFCSETVSLAPCNLASKRSAFFLETSATSGYALVGAKSAFNLLFKPPNASKRPCAPRRFSTSALRWLTVSLSLVVSSRYLARDSKPSAACVSNWHR